ncbi:MAG: hypothetical protein Fur0024_0030 [Patescibacteria group bacterium]
MGLNLKKILADIQVKTPSKIIEEIIAYLESKGIAKNIIKEFLDEMEEALKESLAKKIAESIDPKKYKKAKEDLGQNATQSAILQAVGITDDDTNKMLVQILLEYLEDLKKVLSENS